MGPIPVIHSAIFMQHPWVAWGEPPTSSSGQKTVDKYLIKVTQRGGVGLYTIF